MAEEGFKRKLAAILSADVEGYSRLMDDDEEATVRTLTSYRNAISDLVQQFRGRVVDAPGDNLLAEFTSVVDAVNCAVEIQRDLAERNTELAYNRQMQFRIGVNLGDVIEEDSRIYGDGVNIAARVESLAEAGGICISGRAHDQVENKLGLEYEDLGKHEVKNISRPIQVYRVLSYPGAAAHRVVHAKETLGRKWRKVAISAAVAVVIIGGLAYWQFYMRRPTMEPASVDKMAYPLPEKPSIAVLPFDNMSGDPEQEFLSDGISENIITSLSKTDELFVIARNSTFTYKGKPVNVKQVAEDLGVRYVLEGSVQKSEDRVRITAQLIDAISGHHLWAERYDRDLKDIFALQDEITKKIIVSLGVTLQEGEQLRVWAEKTKNLDYFLKFTKAIYHLNKFTLENARVAGRIGHELIEMEPQNPSGYDILGWYYLYLYFFGVSPKENLAKAHQMAKKSLSLDESNPMAHLVMSDVSMTMRLYDKAIAEAEQAIALSPNFAYAYQSLGQKLSYAGRPDEAIEKSHQAMRLDPFPSIFVYCNLGRSYLQKHQYEQALVEYNKAYQQSPDSIMVLLSLAVTYGLLGREDEAREKANKLLEIIPDYSLERIRKSPFKNQSDMELFVQGSRKAGIPETPLLPLPDKPSIAVLPFDNLSGDPEQEYFSDGLTDELIGDLAQIKDIFVISRNSAFTYKGKSTKAQDIANDLNVRYILEGSVQRSGNKVRIRAQLIDGKTDHHLWAESYDGVMDDIFDLQDKITGKIVTALAIKLTPEEKDKISEKGTDNLLAYDAYLKGFEHYSRMTGQNLLKAVEYYHQAIEIDPNFSRAYTALAITYWMMSWHDFAKQLGISNPIEFMTFKVKARYFLEIAMKKPNFEAYRLAAYLDVHRRKYDRALANAEKALALAPNSNIAHGAYSIILNWIGRPDEALLHLDKAMKLDPKFVDLWLAEKGKAYYLLGDYNKAVELIERSLKLNPGLTAYATYAAASYAFLGQQNEAERAWKIFKDSFSFGLSPTTKFLYFGMPFKNKKVFDRFVEGLVKAGFQGDPSDYYIVHKNKKLSGDQIKNRFYGKTANGYTSLGVELVLKFDTSGKVESSFPQFDNSDKAKSFVENDQLCFEFEKWYGGIKSCSDYYNNPEGTHINKSQFIRLNDIGMHFFSIKE